MNTTTSTTTQLPARHPDRQHGVRGSQSEGHIRWEGDYEIYRIGDDVYRAHYSTVYDLTTNARMGRWQGPYVAWMRLFTR